MVARDLPVLIAFGANIDPLPNLWRGLRALHERVGLAAVSTVYRTPALPDREGRDPGPDFLNGAVRVESRQEPFALKGLLRTIEAELHRIRGPWRHAPRTLDLDIALMGEQVVQRDGLVVPDPELLHRAFLALPLAELAPELLHPLEGVPLSRIAARFSETLCIDQPATLLLQSIVTGAVTMDLA